MIWLALLIALSAAAHVRWLVPRLPPPTDDDSPDYRALGSRVQASLVGVAAGAAALAVSAQGWHGLVWFGYLGTGSALVYVDLRTTYLPKRLHYLTAAQVGLALVALARIAPLTALISVLAGAGFSGLLWLVWRFGQLGYGDVRLGGIVAAVAATMGLDALAWSLLTGSVIGAVWGIVHALRQRWGQSAAAHFPYGPSLWLGPIVVAWATRW